MPTQKYRVHTDKGDYIVEVEAPQAPINMQAKGGDTINGEDPNDPGLFSRITGALGHAAQPESLGDFLSLIIPSGMGEAITGIKDSARILKQATQESPTLRGIPGQAMKILRERPKTLQDFQSEGFNRLPLQEQMRHLPEVPAPPTMRMGEPLPTIKVPTVQGEVMGARPPGPSVVEGEVVRPKGLPPATSTQMPAASPSTELENQLLEQADQQGRQMAQDVPWNGDPVEDALDRAANRRQEAFTDRVNGVTPSEIADEGLSGTGKAAEEIGEVGEPAAAEAQEAVTMQGDTPDPNGMLEALGGGTTPEDVIPTAPLGKPRVISWKSGHGPSDELIGQVRDEEGSKSAAHRLAIPQKQVLERAPRMSPRALPPEAQNRIRSNMEGMSLEEKLKYLEQAPSGLSEAFIKSILESQ